MFGAPSPSMAMPKTDRLAPETLRATWIPVLVAIARCARPVPKSALSKDSRGSMATHSATRPRPTSTASSMVRSPAPPVGGREAEFVIDHHAQAERRGGVDLGQFQVALLEGH